MNTLKQTKFKLLITLAVFASLFFTFFLISHKQKAILENDNSIRYAVIGDSYSNGEGATPEESWPTLLTHDLQKKGIKIKLVANPSVTGWTTQQALDQEIPVFDDSHPTFGTLQIGVNDWVQGVDKEIFKKNLITLIEKMQKTLSNKNRLLLVTIPDFSQTPTGKMYSNGRDISQGITEFNNIIKNEGGKRNIQVVDIFPESKKVKNDPQLVAPDGLHPSATEYKLWEKLIYASALTLLSK